MAKGTATIDFGATPVDEAIFSVTDAAIIGATYVEAFFMGSDTTVDNDAEAHQIAAAFIRTACGAPNGSGQFAVYATLIAALVTGTFKLRYVGS